MITIYDDEASPQGYQVRAALGVLGLDFRSVAVQEYDLDPDAAPPAVVLVDDRSRPAAVVHDPTAALLYLATTYDPDGDLLGRADPARLAGVLDWVHAARALTASAGVARVHDPFDESVDVAALQREAHRLLGRLDRHLWFGEQEGSDFLVGGFSLADIAWFGDVALCEEGGISRQDHPAVRRWCDRVTRVPGFPLMSGIFAAAEYVA